MRNFLAAAASAPPPALVERFGPDDLRSGSLRLPPGRGPFPVAVLIHGGCWSKGFGSRRDMEALGAALSGRGIAVWNIEFRQLGDPGGGYPGTFEDVARGIDHLAALVRGFPLDLGRVAYIGHSTGAELALWAASRAKLGGRWRKEALVAPASVVAIDGPGSMAGFMGVERQFCGKPVVASFLGGTPRSAPARYRFASAADHLPLDVPQLLVSAALASLVQPYAEAASRAGDKMTTLPLPGADHFGIATPDTRDGAAVIAFIADNAFGGHK